MRILASNPDGIGDFLLRQPLYAALVSAGHDLLLLVRPHHLPLAPLVAPGALVFVIDGDPYSEQMLTPHPAVHAAAAVARDFSPDLLLVAPYQWTAFEERLAEALPGVPVTALSGRMFRGDLRGGHDWPSTLRPDAVAAVHEDEPETEKNRRLAKLILGGDPQLPRPRIVATVAQRTAADALLARHGLRRHDFVLACVGEHADNAVRNWGLEDWAAVLAHWVERHGRAVALVGSESERAASERIREMMAAAGRRAVLIFEPNAPLEPLIGLADAARAYIGRDTGPMHVAAALDKPVIAVFGGGHWPRFVPAAPTGLVATVGVPCIGCDWVCPFDRAVCIRDVPRESVTSAIDVLERGERSDRPAAASEQGASGAPCQAAHPQPAVTAPLSASRQGGSTADGGANRQGGSTADGGASRQGGLETHRAASEQGGLIARETVPPQGQSTAPVSASERAAPGTLRVLVHQPASTTIAAMLRQSRERNHDAQRRLHAQERSLRILHSEHAACLPDAELRLRETERTAARLESRATLSEAALAAAESQNAALCAEIARLRSEILRAAEARHDAELRARALETERAALGRVTLEAGARFEQVSTELAHAQADAVRYRQYVDDLRRSRWRKLGLKLGAARRAAWEDRDDMR
ncbi:MAG: hypothetical protein HRU75_14190 [Planctomycetia bacterium]|nr:MAG: hypothetical protein HRU75_14190 [Planctomycetia bacterium]